MSLTYGSLYHRLSVKDYDVINKNVNMYVISLTVMIVIDPLGVAHQMDHRNF
jgi:hypothetical protein